MFSAKNIVFVFILITNCVPPSEEALGVPDFLELGRCFNATLKDGFEPIKYQGIWFSIERVPNEYEHATRCVSMNYTWDEDRLISVGRGLTEEDKKVKQISEIIEEWELREPPHPAYMTVIAVGVPESPYEILATDYVTYSCVHSCLEYFGFKAEFFWVFGRTPYLSRRYVDLCHNAFTELGVDTNKLMAVPHGEHCPYNKKLGGILEYNRQLLIRQGLLDTEAPILSSLPPPTLPPTAYDETLLEEDHILMAPPLAPRRGDETVLENPEESDVNSSPPSKINDVAIPLFVMMAVFVPALAR